MQINNGLRLSCEFFPPRSKETLVQLKHSAKTLLDINPLFYSVTFGAGGSTKSGTFDTVSTLKQEVLANVAPHLSCYNNPRSELIELIQNYKKLGVKRIVALRGDAVEGQVNSSELKLAFELVRLIRETTGQHFQIDVAAYPEYHPQAKSALYDVFNLKKKFEAGANSAITQFFYNYDAYFYFIEACEKQGIDMPIIPGIMPIMNLDKLMNFSKVCGAEIPLWLYKRLAAYEDDINSMREFALDVVIRLCEKLIEAGVPGLHFYTLNQANLTLKIVDALNLVEKTKKVSSLG